MTPAHLVAPAVTLALGWIVALIAYFAGSDVPSAYLGDRVIPSALALAAIAAPVALLFAWGEVDLSSVGMVPFAGYIYAEVSETGVAAGLLAAVASGLAIGAAIGLLRWSTRAPSAVLSLAVGFVLQALTLKLVGGQGGRSIEEGVVEGSGLPALAAVGFTSLTVAAAVALGRPDGGDSAVTGPRGASLVVGFGLSGAAAGAFGALTAAIMRGTVAGSGPLLLLFSAVAIGGVVRGNRLVGPVAAAVGALAAQLLTAAGPVRAWDRDDHQLLVAAVLGVCLLISHASDRLLGLLHPGASRQPGPTTWPPSAAAWGPPPSGVPPATPGPPPPPG